ncbi:MAG: tagaturonate reductase [Bacteroidetes bacterium]|nr:tagaturonate reductase [Bacteroidota bacterium]
MQLSKKNLPNIVSTSINKPLEEIFELPEKVLQFGTGALLRGLPDYFIDKANKKGIFNGRVIVVKSTSEGGTDAFQEQDGLYTLCIRGIENGQKKEENLICAAISRVLAAQNQWAEILQCAAQPALKIIISNTTEVGIRLQQESIFQQPPVSFPAKLLAFLYERYTVLKAAPEAGMVIIPTELITDNGNVLRSIVMELAQFNKLDAGFMEWLQLHNIFCNSLVDCIVPGKPDEKMLQQFEKDHGYNDRLILMSEVYRLWAIDGGEPVKRILSFAEVSNEVVVTEDISIFKELKLRLLNGTHSLSCGLAFLAGLPTVKKAMGNGIFSNFVKKLMLNEIAGAIPFALPITEANTFALKVIDRFSNPYVQHKWISISLHYSSKMAQRVVPVLLRYYQLNKTAPEYLSLGFAGYLLFMRPIKKEGDKYFGEQAGQLYPINDEKAVYYYDLWQEEMPIEKRVTKALGNESLWGADLTQISGFVKSVSKKMEIILSDGVLPTLKTVSENKNNAG